MYYYEVCWSNSFTVYNGLTMNPRTLFFKPEHELGTCKKITFAFKKNLVVEVFFGSDKILRVVKKSKYLGVVVYI